MVHITKSQHSVVLKAKVAWEAGGLAKGLFHQICRLWVENDRLNKP